MRLIGGRARTMLVTCGLIAFVAVMAPALIATSVQADEYHAFLCAVPPGDTGEGDAAPTDDVSYAINSSYMQAGASCGGGGGSMYALMDGSTTHSFTAEASDTFSAPAGLSIAGFTMWRYEEVGPVLPYGAPVTNLSYSNVISVEGLCAQSDGCSYRGTSSPWYAGVNELSVGGLSGVSYLRWAAVCGGGSGGTCPESGTAYSAAFYVYSLDLLLEDSTPPSASEITVPTATVGGTQEVLFHASDGGSGVYSAWIVVDGSTVVGPTILNTNGGACQNLGATRDGLRSFLHPKPCPSSVDGALSLNTAALKDGLHNASLHIDDAAGNEVVAKAWTFTSDNAPTVSKAPSVSGLAEVGSTLTATNGAFAAPVGAGSLSAVTGQWLRCTDAKAQECTEIPGATGVTFSPSGEDVGYYMVYQDSVSDNDGSTASDSQPTIAVTAPTTTPSCANSECLHSGTGGTGGSGGTGGTGGSGGSSTGSGGSGASGTASGVTINLTEPGAPANTTLLGSKAKWAVTLNVTPKRVHKGTTIKITGLVTTSPRPSAGKLIYVQARSVTSTWKGTGANRHRVTVYGKWITFAALRTAASGDWFTGYEFHLGGPHVYEMQAIAPQEGGFQNPTGTSSILTITET